MDLIQVVVVLIVIGVLVGLLNKFGTEWIAAPFLRLINAIVVIAVVLWLLIWLLHAVGLWTRAVPLLGVGR